MTENQKTLDIISLKMENRRLREALEIYADPKSWDYDDEMVAWKVPNGMILFYDGPGWDIAQKALDNTEDNNLQLQQINECKKLLKTLREQQEDL